MVRIVAGVVAGLLVALLLLALLSAVVRYGFAPAALDPSDPEARRLMMMQTAPLGLLLHALARGVAAFAGGWLAAGLVRRGPRPAWAVAALTALACAYALVSSGQPIWFIGLWAVAIAGAGWLAGKAGGSRLDTVEAPAHARPVEPAPAFTAAPPRPAWTPDPTPMAPEPEPVRLQPQPLPEPEVEPLPFDIYDVGPRPAPDLFDERSDLDPEDPDRNPDRKP